MIAIKTHVVEILMERILVNANQVRAPEPLGMIETDKSAAKNLNPLDYNSFPKKFVAYFLKV